MNYYRNTGGAGALVFARRLTGLWYLFGGTAPGRTDCSGLVEWSYAQVGVVIERSTFAQYREDPINDRNIPSEPGDLHFIPGSDAIGKLPGHVEMYVSPGQVFQAEETGTRIGQFARDTNNWEYRSRPALELPFAPVPPPPVKPLPPAKGHPTAVDLCVANLVGLKNGAEAQTAIHNGWHLFYFSQGHHPNPFCPQVGSRPDKVTLYANQSWRSKT